MRRQVFVTGFRGVALHATSNFFRLSNLLGACNAPPRNSAPMQQRLRSSKQKDRRWEAVLNACVCGVLNPIVCLIGEEVSC